MTRDVRLTSPDGTPLAAAYTPADGGPAVVVVPGYGSRKENHADFAALAATRAGLATLVLDVRGHGASGGTLDINAVDDVLAAIDWVAERHPGPVGLRGSSMGGYLSLVAADRHPRVGAVAAICPAQATTLRNRAEFTLPPIPELPHVVGDPRVARGYWHARGDEIVPWQGTFALADATPQPRRFHLVMGGHHRSLQHDPRIMAATVDFLAEHLARDG